MVVVSVTVVVTSPVSGSVLVSVRVVVFEPSGFVVVVVFEPSGFWVVSVCVES